MAHISYTMSTRGLPDMYTLSPRACGPRASGVHIRQTTRVHGITITYTTMTSYIKGTAECIVAHIQLKRGYKLTPIFVVPNTEESLFAVEETDLFLCKGELNIVFLYKEITSHMSLDKDVPG